MDLFDPIRKPRGFAAMDPDKRRELARKGGKSVPAAKRSFSANRQLAITSGRKGGINSHRSADK